MKHQLQALLAQALDKVAADLELSLDKQTIHLEATRDKQHGDFATNMAMALTRIARRNPRELAQLIIDALPDSPIIEKTEIAGPGFINFYLKSDAWHGVVGEILTQVDNYGRCDHGQGAKIQIEFVSANPTGPLHVGHGRGAAFGATLANFLTAVGYQVEREYYVNDAGRQMDILATSIWLRYVEACGETLTFPSNGYQGDYISDIANDVLNNKGDGFKYSAAEVFAGVPADANDGGDKEQHIDGLIANAKRLLGDNYSVFVKAGLDVILSDIREDLGEFGVEYEQWFSERSLVDSQAIDKAIARLNDAGHLYKKEGALWFKSSDFGDEKDRVVLRDNGQPTYFASDIAYHLEKYSRGYQRVINIWGADHHGYIARVKGAIQAAGEDPDKLEVLLVQFANLFRNGEKVSMSTRSGSFVTLRELREEVGNDAARFFYVMRRTDQHMDFDLDLAKSQSNDNPVFYIQYAHARIYTVMDKLAEKELGALDTSVSMAPLQEEHETDIMISLSRYPEVVLSAAMQREPHQLVNYLKQLSSDFHGYYNAHAFLVDDNTLRNARLTLITSVAQVIKNGLNLLGVSAPKSM
ncbi:MAG: arginine--tRNA ligase [Gammaproteobacteria bacterium]|nr:MAG: arginine--tRNA ligase [Gammaproteobacteria bacterium]